MATFKLKLIGVNNDGSRIFTVLRYGKKRLLKGFYDFDTEHFTILQYNDKNFPDGMNRKHILAILKERLMLEHNWEL